MTTVPLGEAKDRLSALVDAVATTHDVVTITRHGRPAAMLISPDDLESLRETAFWVTQPGVHSEVAEARAARAEGRTVPGDQLRTEFGLDG